MLNLNRTPWRVLLGLFLLTLCTSPLLIAETPHLAVAQFGGSVVSWQPQVQYERLTLRVSGPAGTFTRVFKEGEVPFFDLAALEGPVDGSYTFELTATPRLSPEVRQMLQAAREDGDNASTARRFQAQGSLPSEPLVQSGYLRVAGGQFVSPDADEPGSDTGALQPRTTGGDSVSSTGGESLRNLSAADQVILDDLIVDGSICVGFDCVNGESFGFDTLKLKENNLRIKFDDTSNSGSFPNNDWQLTANDSSNGGANKFSIDDITGGRTPFTIEASAPSNSLYVDDGGRVGLGTSTPVVELHVVDGDTPTLRLEQNGSSGFTPQTWDVAGNETNFFVRDVTNGSQLPFRIIPGADSSSLVITADNDVLIAGNNATSADASLHVKRSDGTAQVLVEETNSTVSNRVLLNLKNKGGTQMQFENTATNVVWNFSNASGGVFRINNTGNTGFELDLSQTGDLTVLGGLTIGTSPCNGCDLVFKEPKRFVETIEDHAHYMWANSHLPGVGPTPEDGPFDIGQKTAGILNELEKAHIYIEQLNTQLGEKDQKIAQVEQETRGLIDEKEQQIEQLEGRIAALEHLLAGLAEQR
jgi:hypothetical protein